MGNNLDSGRFIIQICCQEDVKSMTKKTNPGKIKKDPCIKINGNSNKKGQDCLERKKKKPEHSHKIEIKNRDMTWTFILAFLIGAVFAELTADPLSDLIFFYRSSIGALTPTEQVFYWYYLPAIVYATLFLIALTIAYATKASANIFKYIIIIFAGVSLVFSLTILGFTFIIVLLLLIPFILLVFIMYKKTIIKNKKTNIEI